MYSISPLAEKGLTHIQQWEVAYSRKKLISLLNSIHDIQRQRNTARLWDQKAWRSAVPLSNTDQLIDRTYTTSLMELLYNRNFTAKLHTKCVIQWAPHKDKAWLFHCIVLWLYKYQIIAAGCLVPSSAKYHQGGCILLGRGRCLNFRSLESSFMYFPHSPHCIHAAWPSLPSDHSRQTIP